MNRILLALALVLNLSATLPGTGQSVERGSPVIVGAAGNYAGLLEGIGASPGNTHLDTGILNVLVNDSGAFSALLNWKGFKYPFKGRFDDEAQVFTQDFPDEGNSGGTLALSLKLVTSNHTIHAELTVESNGSSYVVPGDLSGDEPDPAAAAAFAGSLNTSFIDPPGYGSVPQDLRGDGFTVARVSKRPGAQGRFAGRLPDNEPFAAGSFLRGTEYTLFNALYKKDKEFGGATFGKVSVADLASIQNVLLWIKGAGVDPNFYPAGFDTGYGIKSVFYILSKLRGDPFRQIPKISLNPGPIDATLTFREGNLGETAPGQEATLIAKIRITPFRTIVRQPNPQRISLQTSALSATWKGSFIHPVSGRRIAFHGAFIQARDGINGEGRGSFKGSVLRDSTDLPESGSVRISVD